MFLGVSVGNGLRGRITLQKIFIGSRARGGRVTPVGRTRLGRGAMKIKEEETTFLLKRTTFKEKKTGVVFGCFCWKRGARGDNFASEKTTE